MNLTETEKRIIAQALMDYQEGIEVAIKGGAEMALDLEDLDDTITSIEAKLELPA